jgi:hypothetical protein
MEVKNEKSRQPSKWMTRVYRLLAVGKYAAIWVPEFLILYEQIMLEQGHDKAQEWALEELLQSIRPSIALRVYRIIRILYLGWKAYRKMARD